MTVLWLADNAIGPMRGRAVRRDLFRIGLTVWMLCLSGIPGRAQDAEPGEVAGGVRVPEINDQGIMTSLLTGREVRFRPRKPMEITGLEIFFFEPDGVTVRMNAVSPGCYYDSIKGKAFSDKPIRIEGSGFVITGTRYEYMASEQTMEIFEDVKVELKNVNLGDLTPSTSNDSPEDASDDEADLTLTP
ncbi:MAG: LPS export ABC transporter periplasmic protein LptC [Verrucomicrobia bacterium]|nr:LPS export ABC transporter periplasmic protein LptC [Verrucomicrobiota bacterium]MCH8527942.1 LPS export ABC transporter periplasmic protein LptC [Kiritimatiellia bacterium]